MTKLLTFLLKSIGRALALLVAIAISFVWLGGWLYPFASGPVAIWVISINYLCYTWSIGFVSPESEAASREQIQKAAKAGLILSLVTTFVCASMYALEHLDNMTQIGKAVGVLLVGILYSSIIYYACFFPYFHKQLQNIDELKKKQ